VGEEFAEKHASEVFAPMLKSYERALQNPQIKILPLWITTDGRLVNYFGVQMKGLLDNEVMKRINNPQKYRANTDYLQMLVNNLGDKYVEGTSH
jgi:hypothetical protein